MPHAYDRLIDLSFQIGGDVWPISVNGDNQNITLRFWGEGQGEINYAENASYARAYAGFGNWGPIGSYINFENDTTAVEAAYIPSIGTYGSRFIPRFSAGQNRLALFYKGYPVGWKGLPYENAVIEGVIPAGTIINLVHVQTVQLGPVALTKELDFRAKPLRKSEYIFGQLSLPPQAPFARYAPVHLTGGPTVDGRLEDNLEPMGALDRSSPSWDSWFTYTTYGTAQSGNAARGFPIFGVNPKNTVSIVMKPNEDGTFADMGESDREAIENELSVNDYCHMRSHFDVEESDVGDYPRQDLQTYHKKISAARGTDSFVHTYSTDPTGSSGFIGVVPVNARTDPDNFIIVEQAIVGKYALVSPTVRRYTPDLAWSPKYQYGLVDLGADRESVEVPGHVPALYRSLANVAPVINGSGEFVFPDAAFVAPSTGQSSPYVMCEAWYGKRQGFDYLVGEYSVNTRNALSKGSFLDTGGSGKVIYTPELTVKGLPSIGKSSHWAKLIDYQVSEGEETIGELLDTTIFKTANFYSIWEIEGSAVGFNLQGTLTDEQGKEWDIVGVAQTDKKGVLTVTCTRNEVQIAGA